MTHLDLCTGIGGFHIAAQWAGFETVGFSETEPYCCKLLAEKWPEIPNYGDLRTADFSDLRGGITVLSAGAPCQPASLAGKRRGRDDHRWLWDAVLDVVGRVKPAWCIFENPDGILSLDEFGGVLLRLETLGYEVRMFRVPANSVGAKHRRNRVFIVANAGSRRLSGPEERESEQSRGTETIGASKALENSRCEPGERGCGGREQEASGRTRVRTTRSGEDEESLAHAASARCGQGVCGEGGEIRNEAWRQESNGRSDESEALADPDAKRLEELQPCEDGRKCAAVVGGRGPNGFRLTESPLCRATDELPNRSHRLKALGNAVCPAQAFPFFEAIYQVETCQQNQTPI